MAVAEIPLTNKERNYIYEGEAALLEFELKEPFREKVRPQGRVELYGAGDRSHYEFKHAAPYHLEGIASFHSGYTQVAGARSLKHEKRYSTLVTSSLEGLNILDVLTADRVVAQISTAHSPYGGAPEVSFLGTRFENLKIAGQDVVPHTNLEILGPRPVEQETYFNNQHVMDRIAQQYENLSKGDYFPDWATERYPRDNEGWRPKNGNPSAEITKFSLVDYVESDQKSFGHVIDVPHFGKFFLGELTMKRIPACDDDHYDRYILHLDMVRTELGCTVAGGGGASSATSGGQGSGGGGVHG